MATSQRSDMWLLRLVPRVRNGRIISGLVLLATLLGLFATTGIFEDPEGPVPPPVVVFFSVLIAYIVPVFHYITELTCTAVRDLAPRIGDEARTARLIEGIRRRTLAEEFGALAIGLTAGCVHHLLLAGSVAEAVRIALYSPASAGLAVGTLAVWIFLTNAIFALVKNARVFRMLGRTIPIDLLSHRAYTPFARVAVSSTLAIIGAQAAFPIMWIDADASALATIPGLIATTVAMAFLFGLPLWPIHRAIAKAKREELQRLDALINATAAALPAQHDGIRIAQLNPLLAYRREIEAVREWPFDTNVAGRLALYLVIPPLTWVGAALIEMLVEDLV